ncbi:hypothetical protein CERSUDRAFT_84853 [Gelatoporia subvermispora B]|uniref:FAD/NAD(P)-binding domain-containing protein n=1 Tax=Ceriporiopsis subvermispora (strain B) TaxID=914234 RepID=M2RAD8_CERS8|nr:hypothetical protein CERSUDRAFT_84853 [Gelatoporia subvermispora B]
MSSAEIDPVAIATAFLKQFEAATSSGDVDAFRNLFLPIGWMRDHLVFSWDLRSLEGPEKLSQYLSEAVGNQSRFAAASLHNVTLETGTTIGPITFPVPGGAPDAKGVQGPFRFELQSPAGFGRGYFRLVPDAEGNFKVFALYVTLEDLKGHEEPKERPNGLFAGHSKYWSEEKAERHAAVENDPTVVVVGGGQAGLMCAARLSRMGVHALVIERSPRVGDVWRERYPNLTLHTSAHHSSVLYHPWPQTYPKFIAKDIVADFLESYAIGQDLVVWTSSTVLPTPTYDNGTGTWTIPVDREGKKVTVKAKHIIMATGNGRSRIPDFPGMAKFKGPLYHSDKHRGAAPFAGKRAVVIGACNAGADIAQDFVAKGASEVTMVQRTATCVISAKAINIATFEAIYPETRAIEDGDLLYHSLPPRLGMRLAAGGGTARLKALDKDLHEALAAKGFKLTWELTPGGGEVGLLGFFFERVAAGSMVDVGCGQLIIDGKVKMKSGVEVDHFEEDGVVFADGSKVLADVVVLATGNLPIIENTAELFGERIKSKIGSKVWGLDAEGELTLCYRPTGQPGLWYAPGAFQHSRYHSKHLALQILAQELGIAPMPVAKAPHGSSL